MPLCRNVCFNTSSHRDDEDESSAQWAPKWVLVGSSNNAKAFLVEPKTREPSLDIIQVLAFQADNSAFLSFIKLRFNYFFKKCLKVRQALGTCKVSSLSSVPSAYVDHVFMSMLKSGICEMSSVKCEMSNVKCLC